MLTQRRSRRLKGLEPIQGQEANPALKSKSPECNDEFQHSQGIKLWFQYKPLDHQSDNIRVISILPAESDHSPLHCTIEHVTLSDTHSCLSYAWGLEAADCLISINNRSFLIRPNLWNFLRQARKLKVYGPLWIDAICIKQNDNQERNHQVARMARIYSQATVVYVWLGCGSIAIEKTLQFLTSDSTAQALTKYALRLELLSKVQAIMALPYWSRLRIGQELVLARDAKVLYGSTEMLWSSLVSVGWQVDRVLSEISDSRRHRGTQQSYEGPLHLLRQYVDVSEDREEALAQVAQLEGCELTRLRDIATLPIRRSGGPRELHLVSLITTFELSLCQDPRDHVYALLGFVGDAEALSVNYEESCFDLLRRILQTYKAESRKDSLLRIRSLSQALAVTNEQLRKRCLQRYPIGTMDSSLSPISSNLEIWRRISSEASQQFWTGSAKMVTAGELCPDCISIITSTEGWTVLDG